MISFLSLFSFIVLLAIVLVIAIFRIGFGTISVRGKMRTAQTSPWNLHEFLSLNPSKLRHNECYRFNEEPVRSHARRFVGRFDGAILHWEEAPILDMIIENKFPVNYVPEKAAREDIFQAGLYALALAETGVSCKDAKLVIIYCLQDVAQKCLNGNSPRKCGDCGEGKLFSQNFDQHEITKSLTKIDEVWYKKRQPRANPSISNCRPCPYSKDGRCNHSVV